MDGNALRWSMMGGTYLELIGCLGTVLVDLLGGVMDFNIKARSHDPFLRIQFLLVPKIGSCEHIENDLPTHGSVMLKNGWK